MQKRKTFYVFGKKITLGKTLVKLTLPASKNGYTEPVLSIKELNRDGSVSISITMAVRELKSLVDSPSEPVISPFRKIGMSAEQVAECAQQEEDMWLIERARWATKYKIMVWAEHIIEETPF